MYATKNYMESFTFISYFNYFNYFLGLKNFRLYTVYIHIYNMPFVLVSLKIRINAISF